MSTKDATSIQKVATSYEKIATSYEKIASSGLKMAKLLEVQIDDLLRFEELPKIAEH